jgi:hypothetical protein
MAGAAALLGGAVAWFAACEGGRHRDGTASGVRTDTVSTRRQ